ncbi:MAG: hypothetical protein R2727_09435 [Bacteroidales bacterium]
MVKTESLSDLGPGEVDLIEKEIKDDTIRRRALHVVTENGRVLEAVRLLHISDLEGFGRMMNLSHDSLRNNYEVTGTELDTLVYEARKIDGVIGSRMTGAGFGGCTVNIVKKTAAGNFTEALGRIYREKTGLDASFYVPTIEDGAHLLS